MKGDLFSMPPSQAYELIKSLNDKKEYEGLTEEESNELDELTNLFSETTFDFDEVDY